MKNPFDRIVGPDGTRMFDGSSDDAQSSGRLNAREEFALRCLNAAANLYGVMSMEDFVRLYNGYAQNHKAPISDVMTVEELDGLVDKLQTLSEPDNPSMVDVYIALGVIAPAHFESPALILKIVLSGLGLPTELPIRLSFSDQAKFATETICRIHATGRFDAVVAG